MSFNQRYNTDDVLFRAITIGLLNLLNRKIVIKQTIGPDQVQDVSVPFFYFMYQDERFMQDFYQLFGADCDGPKYAEGGTDPVPRGVIQIASMSINSAALTNKFVRGTFNKEVDGEIKAYSAFLNPIPLTITWDVEIWAGTFVEAMKIVQQTIDTFYKVSIFSVDYTGLRIPCQVGFSQDYNIEKPVTFSYGEDNKIMVKFSLEMETYQPVFDKVSLRFRGNVMDNGIGNVLVDVNGTNNAKVEVNPDTFGQDHAKLNPVDPIAENEEKLKAPYGRDIDGKPINFPESPTKM